MDKKDRLNNLKKKYLSQLFYIKGIIKSNEEKIKERRLMIKNNIKPIDYAKEQVKGGDRYSWDSLILEVDKLERELIDNNIELIKKEREIFNCLKNVKDYQHRLLLQYRYFDFKDWNEIEHLLNMSPNTRNNKHSEALNKLHIENLFKK